MVLVVLQVVDLEQVAHLSKVDMAVDLVDYLMVL